jgi:MFS family permease
MPILFNLIIKIESIIYYILQYQNIFKMQVDKENTPLNKSNSQTFNLENIQDDSENEAMISKGNSSIETSMTLLDEIMQQKGYTLKTIKFMFLAFLMISIEGLHTNFFGFIIIPLQKYYQVSEKSLGIVSAFTFFGISLGSLLSGIITQKFGRTQSINFLLFKNALSCLLCWIIHDYIVFAILRFFIGFSLGLFEPVTLNILAEYLPIKHRASILTSVWVGFQGGAIYLLFIIAGIMPNYESAKVPLVFLLHSILAIFSFVVSIFFLEDSLRNYILNNNSAKAFKILENDYELELSLEKKSTIENQTKYHNNIDEKNLSSIFREKIFVLTLLLSLIWFIDSFVSYGLGIITSLTLKKLGVAEKNNIEITMDQLYMNILGGVGTIIGGLLCEINHLGRVRTTVISSFISTLLLLLMTFFDKHYTLIICINQFFLYIAINVNTTYTCEVYATSERDKATGFLFFLNRMGGVFSQYLYLVFNDFGIWAPYYISCGIFF